MTLDDFISSWRCSMGSQRRDELVAGASDWILNPPTEPRLMSPVDSVATRPARSASFAAVAMFATLMGVASLASARMLDTCPPAHRKVDEQIHARMHRQQSDRERPARKYRDRDQSERRRPARHRVIVRAKAGMREALEAAGRNRGQTIRGDHDFINAFSAEVDEDDLERLAADPRIESVSFDATMHGDQVALYDPMTLIAQRTARGTSTAAPNPAALRGTLAVNGSGWTGSGVTVALIDSGLEPSVDFTGRIKAFYDFTLPGAPAAAPSDGEMAPRAAGVTDDWWIAPPAPDGGVAQ